MKVDKEFVEALAYLLEIVSLNDDMCYASDDEKGKIAIVSEFYLMIKDSVERCTCPAAIRGTGAVFVSTDCPIHNHFLKPQAIGEG